MEITIDQAAASRHADGRVYDMDAQSISAGMYTPYGGSVSVTYWQQAEPPTPTTRSHKCKGIMAAKQRAKEARAAYLRGVAADLIGKRLDFVFHLFGAFHAAKMEAALTHKRGRVAGAKRVENFVNALATMHGVTEYPVKDIVDAFTATLYPAALAALTRALKRRRLEYGRAVEAVEAVEPCKRAGQGGECNEKTE